MRLRRMYKRLKRRLSKRSKEARKVLTQSGLGGHNPSPRVSKRKSSEANMETIDRLVMMTDRRSKITERRRDDTDKYSFDACMDKLLSMPGVGGEEACAAVDALKCPENRIFFMKMRPNIVEYWLNLRLKEFRRQEGITATSTLISISEIEDKCASYPLCVAAIPKKIIQNDNGRNQKVIFGVADDQHNNKVKDKASDPGAGDDVDEGDTFTPGAKDVYDEFGNEDEEYGYGDDDFVE
ncbi:hypothetical protein J5N97_025187 [Dioscorea zingiberensis]|uniref:Uncharacterized protein n=1 Tax=Dioscorea zingiberensis TaxID=325984 RepID=A0A9D5C8G1_9LILI|nr:hypothetical protein J5N97_025187 [Dioscorea zingiberensis]